MSIPKDLLKRKTYMRDIHLVEPLFDRVLTVIGFVTDDPDYEGWDKRMLQAVTIESVEPGKTICTVTIQPFMANRMGNLHGGCATSLLDNLSSSALISLAKKDFMDWGTVSRTLQMAFLKAVPVGTKCRIVCEAVTTGKRLAHCKAQLELMDGTVCVTCTHDKAVNQEPKPKL